MKTIKIAIKLSLALLTLSSTTIFADNFQMKRMGGNPVQITFCNTVEAAAKLAFIKNTTPHSENRPDAISKAKEELKCHSEMQAAEYTLHKLTFVKLENAKYDYEILDIIDQPNSQHKFIAKDSLGPYFYVDTSCQPNSAGGQVNRMEADKDGRLYLKKYLVTSSCVDGKSKVTWKPLN